MANNLLHIREGLKLYRGSIAEVASRCGCKPLWVRQVLDGKYKDDNLVQIAAQVWHDRARSTVETTRQVDILVKKALQAQSESYGVQ